MKTNFNDRSIAKDTNIFILFEHELIRNNTALTGRFRYTVQYTFNQPL